jgi:hypothetical protein
LENTIRPQYRPQRGSIGVGDGIRTRDNELGKLGLYH